MGALKPRPARYRRHDGLHPDEAAKLDAVRRARPPKRDESAAIALAKEFGADVSDVLELFAERSAIRQYDANDSPDDADVGALSDVRDILAAQSRR